MIGIGITVHNRLHTAQRTIEAIKKFAPSKPHKIAIVDDASTTPIPGATFRFEFNVGIARAKNKCIQLLQDCEEIFLFDDDCRPTQAGWEEPYLKAPADLISLNWAKYADGSATGNMELQRKEGLVYFYRPCGVLLYARRKIWETIGGMDPDFIRWGYEHVEWARRAHNRGLIPHPYLGVENPMEKIEADDYFDKLEGSTTPRAGRQIYIDYNAVKFDQGAKASHFIPFETKEEPPIEQAVLCSYFCMSPDPQRQARWTPSLKPVESLLKSLEKTQTQLVLFTDVPEQRIDLHSPFLKIVPSHVDRNFNPVDWRWIAYREWLISNPINKVWMVDSTDVEALKDPFKDMQPGKIYIGEEFNQTVANTWMARTCAPVARNLPNYQFIISRNSRKTLLNAGIIGGELKTVSLFLNDTAVILKRLVKRYGNLIDMAVFNYLALLKYSEQIEHGTHITSRFKQYETQSEAIWKHK